MKTKILKSHPRAHSLKTRELLIKGNKGGVVVTAGLIAYGRGEAFDYLIGERTIASTQKAIKATAALILTARNPVISVNGNVAVLVSKNIAELTRITKAKVEVNLFYRSPERENAIKNLLQNSGIKEVLGTDKSFQVKIPEILSDRRRVDSRGILIADLILVPLEDGDRTEALVKMGKKVIAVDLNPLSRTSQKASVTIVDNIIRTMPLLLKQVRQLRSSKKETLQRIINNYNNQEILNEAIAHISCRLSQLAKKTK
jgi:4-phosphopantoate---beta-alanine ligase